MTLKDKNNARNGLPSQNHMKMRYYTCSWLHLLKNHIWLRNIWRPFCFCPKKFRPRVPKWHPADSCSGHPIVSESIIKRRPYRKTRFRQNPLDYSSDASRQAVEQGCQGNQAGARSLVPWQRPRYHRLAADLPGQGQGLFQTDDRQPGYVCGDRGT